MIFLIVWFLVPKGKYYILLFIRKNTYSMVWTHVFHKCHQQADTTLDQSQLARAKSEAHTNTKAKRTQHKRDAHTNTTHV